MHLASTLCVLHLVERDWASYNQYPRVCIKQMPTMKCSHMPYIETTKSKLYMNMAIHVHNYVAIYGNYNIHQASTVYIYIMYVIPCATSPFLPFHDRIGISLHYYMYVRMCKQDIRENLSSNQSQVLLQSGPEVCPVCGEWYIVGMCMVYYTYFHWVSIKMTINMHGSGSGLEDICTYVGMHDQLTVCPIVRPVMHVLRQKNQQRKCYIIIRKIVLYLSICLHIRIRIQLTRIVVIITLHKYVWDVYHVRTLYGMCNIYVCIQDVYLHIHRLTAFALGSFSEIANFYGNVTFIDEGIMDAAFSYLLRKQNESGCFALEGTVHNYRLLVGRGACADACIHCTCVMSCLE